MIPPPIPPDAPQEKHVMLASARHHPNAPTPAAPPDAMRPEKLPVFVLSAEKRVAQQGAAHQIRDRNPQKLHAMI